MNLFDWITIPRVGKSISRRNFIFTQLDAVGVGITNAAATFLPVFLTRLSATNFQVSLLTSMPAVAGLFLAIPFGRMLERRKNIIPWYSYTRLIYLLGYALSGVVVFILPSKYQILAILIIWGIIALPQTILSITFSVVMSRVGGEDGRFELMTRRWSILGIVTGLFVFLSGFFLKLFTFPLNYQLLLILLTTGAGLAVYSSNRIKLPTLAPRQMLPPKSSRKVSGFSSLIWNEKPFVSILAKRTLYLAGVALGVPFFPLYFVRVAHASDSWIAIIGTVQTVIMVGGYFLWMRHSQTRGSRSVLIWTALIIAVYPIFVALTKNVWLITIYTALAGLFQAGLDLVMFDDLMKTIPVTYSSTFVAVYQSVQYLTSILLPILGSIIADHLGLGMALIISGILKVAGFVLMIANRKEGHIQRDTINP